MNQNITIKIMLGLLAAIILFHFCIVLKIIPYDIAWGGKLKNDNEMYVFESISILVNFFLCFILLIKGKYLNEVIPMKIVNVSLWIFLFLFALNTVGNIFAKTNFEKLFSILTLAFVILIWLILKKDRKAHNTT